jgi:Flp pilus assembly pilin Flp
MNVWGKFVLNDSGVTAIEYSIIVAFITMSAVGAVYATGSQLANVFQGVVNLWSGGGSPYVGGG